MRYRLVLVGASPQNYFLAMGLNELLGGLPHLELNWFVGEDTLAHLPSLVSLNRPRLLPISRQKIDGIQLKTTPVHSINLPHRYIITAKETVPFDWLVLDQGAMYSAGQVSSIIAQVKTLALSSQASLDQKKTGRSRIYCQGTSAESWQLALLIKQFLGEHYPLAHRMVEVLIDKPEGKMGEYLVGRGLKNVTPTFLKLPGLTIAPPQPPLSLSKVRGLTLGKQAEPLLTPQLSPLNHPHTLIVSQSLAEQATMLHLHKQRARLLAKRLVDQTEGLVTTSHLDWQFPVLLLNHSAGPFLQLDQATSTGLPARLTQLLEARALASLLS